ncbi:hypothetical protein VZT92_012187 [Zoarces viviparus]|uniref:Secreted protein n=1 Tax=Zoarces viviparus TaxID=48416 RepID=A0AAW1F6Y7_ZOAVI
MRSLASSATFLSAFSSLPEAHRAPSPLFLKLDKFRSIGRPSKPSPQTESSHVMDPSLTVCDALSEEEEEACVRSAPVLQRAAVVVALWTSVTPLNME